MGQVLFQIWILSFLFYRVDIVGSLSIDNMMVPILVLAWIFVGERKDVRVNRARFRIIGFVTLVFLLLIIIEFAKLKWGGGMAGFYLPVIEHLKHYGYILIPLLYISNEKSLKWTLVSLMVIIVINSGLAVLGALGAAPSFVLAAESSRIPGLLRARGPLVNDGDTALLISYMSLLIWTLRRHQIKFITPGYTLRAIILFILFAGVIATQSRNVILTIAMAFAVYYWLRMMSQKSGSGLQVFLSMLGIGAFLGIITFVVVNADFIITWVTNMFGVSGEGTVRDRLASYSTAVALLDDSMLFGLSSEEIAQNSLFITALHNMWLGMALFSGVFGVSLVFVMVLISLLSALRLVRKAEWKEYGLVLASFILASLWFSPNFYPGHNAFIFWFCIGIALAAGQTLYFARQESSELNTDAVVNKDPEKAGVQLKTRILKYRSTHSL